MRSAPPPLLHGRRRFANIGNGSGCAGTPWTQDASKAFGPLAAQELGAELQLLAWSGAGALVYPGLE